MIEIFNELDIFGELMVLCFLLAFIILLTGIIGKVIIKYKIHKLDKKIEKLSNEN